MTLPAAPGPVWPSASTTRVEATFSERRNNVVTSRTVGNEIKSNGLVVCKPIIKTMIDKAILKVNNKSSAKGGNGNIIIASNRTIINGPETALESNRAKKANNEGFIAD